MADKRDDEEYEDVEWDESAEDEVLFEDDEDESMDDIRLSAEGEDAEGAAKEEAEHEAAEDAGEDEEEEEELEESVEAPPVALSKEELKPINLKKLPVDVSIEVGRLQMTAQALMNLKSGNVLDLNVQPQAGVDLVVNNQLVGRGELVQIGDTLGIRVLEVGK